MNTTPPAFSRSVVFRLCVHDTLSPEAMSAMIKSALSLLDPTKPVSFQTSNDVIHDDKSPNYNPDGAILTFVFTER